MSAAARMTPDWRQWECELADGQFLLERFLGGGRTSAVFLTLFGSEKAAIKLVPADGAHAAELLERWNHTSTLAHPHLIRILKAGTCELAGTPSAYLVTEFADDVLADALAERVLTPDEALEVVGPVANVLQFLHAAGLVHGDLKPSNIFAVNDTIKISCDTVSAGDPSADMSALSRTIVQALSPNRESLDALPHPFHEIARNCARVSSAEIDEWVRSGRRPPNKSNTVSKKPRSGFLAVLALILAAVVSGWFLMRRTETPRAPVAALPSSAEQAAPKPANPAPLVTSHESIVHRVLPEIPDKAKRTIRGKATVTVRVTVDPSGNVTDAKLEHGGSRYFGNLAIAAARKWQFAPSENTTRRHWSLKFEITKTATNVAAN